MGWTYDFDVSCFADAVVLHHFVDHCFDAVDLLVEEEAEFAPVLGVSNGRGGEAWRVTSRTPSRLATRVAMGR